MKFVSQYSNVAGWIVFVVATHTHTGLVTGYYLTYRPAPDAPAFSPQYSRTMAHFQMPMPLAWPPTIVLRPSFGARFSDESV